MPEKTCDSPDIRATLKEVTDATTDWMKTNVLVDDYSSMEPLLEHAISSVVPASDRAILVRYGCELMGKDWHEALPGMAAFEFQNINLLVTDDYFDERTSKRMGVDPISVKWGSKAAVALGFILKSLSNESLLKGWNHKSDWNLWAAIETIEWASKWQYFSQFHEEELSRIPLADVSLDMYLDLISNATATGIAGAFELGYILGGSGDKLRKLFREFGIRLGCLAQIRDDCIDYICDERLIHKGPFSDLFTKRRRLPILAAYWHGTPSEKKLINGILLKDLISLEDVLAITELVLLPKVKNAIIGVSGKIAMEARDTMSELPDVEPPKRYLTQLIELFTDY